LGVPLGYARGLGDVLVGTGFLEDTAIQVRNSWFSSDTATARIMPDGVTRVDVWSSSDIHWKPSQHCFLRFPDISPFDSHPFTIATIESAVGSPRHLVFLTRTHSGFTRKLRSYVQARCSEAETVTTSVWLDGPYGGIHYQLHKRYDTMILLVGGTGITACFPWIQNAMSLATDPDTETKISRVVLVWAMKTPGAVQWLANEIGNLAVDAKIPETLTLEIRVHITGRPQASEAGLSALSADASTDAAAIEAMKKDPIVDHAPLDEATMPSSQLSPVTSLGAAVRYGRPTMPEVLQDFVRQGERTMVIWCGPDTFKADLGNAIASAQTRVVKGEVVELAMHLETFGW